MFDLDPDKKKTNIRNVSRSSVLSHGVALVAVLAVLTILAILAGVFAMVMNVNHSVSKASIAKVQSDLLANSAIEHTRSLLKQDSTEQPGWDDLSESWHSWFRPVNGKKEGAVDVDGLPEINQESPADARWIYVRNGTGEIIGRYAVLVEDESSKINVNSAAALSPEMQSEGVDTCEIMLSDGIRAGLPISKKFARRILEYRYGRNKKPEPTDWDDRTLLSITEVCNHLGRKELTREMRRLLRKYGTVYNCTHDSYWDPEKKIWQKRINLNAADRFQLHRVLRSANEDIPFEPSSRSLRNLVANITDYRDENHVLSTLGSEYGVEAVCFNEIMANDRSMEFLFGWGDAWIAVPELVSPCKNTYYYPMEHWWDPVWPDQYWRINRFNTSGTDYEISIKQPVKPLHPQQETFYKMELPWPADYWQGGQVLIYHDSGGSRSDAKLFDVVKSHAGSNRRLTISPHDQAARDFANSRTNATDELHCFIKNGWSGGWYDWTCYKRLSTVKSYFPAAHRTGRSDFYYKVSVMRETLTKTINPILKELDMDGDTASYSVVEEDQLQYLYKGGEPQRANQYGYVPVTVTSSIRCSDTDNGKPENRIATALFNRPDVVELLNVSDHPVSLMNWKVVVNTGVDALNLATIDTARYYSSGSNGRYDDPNPVIKPNGYFYLTNNRKIFDLEYADGDGVYGNSASEVIPVFELPDKTWGITYRITDLIFPYQVQVEGADWREDQLRNELFSVLTDREESDTNPNGLTFSVLRNTHDSLFKGRGQIITDLGIEVGDYVMVLGLPRQGGFVSFTLKNEYEQVTARTTEYGSVEEEESGYSTEKVDPTHYTWIKNSVPTISGTSRQAANRAGFQTRINRPNIKNKRYTSPAEILRVRSAADWENISSMKGSGSVRVLKALSKYLTVSGIRLEAEDDGAHVSGWKPAFGTVVNSAINTVVVSGDSWPPGIWNGRKLTLISGELSGEEFIITNNTGTSLSVRGYSTATGKKLEAQPGDRFMIGPGFSTAQYYTRRGNEAGIWEWRNKDLEPGWYGLYLNGLNDSIKTTEFLEENWNAELSAEVFNYKTRQYDELPLQEKGSGQDALTETRARRRLQYDKSDGIFCGMISPAHISPFGGIRLRITAHNLENRNCTGFAWFDYAYLAPIDTYGKININTANERVLSALKNITPRLAKNIARGIDRSGKAALKPYRTEASLLDVAGITPALYKDICNLITVRSDQFRVVAVAQSITDVNRDGVFDQKSGDTVASESFKEVVIDRGELTDGNSDTLGIVVYK